MHTRFWFRSVTLGILASLLLASTALAFPPIPARFWGTVTIAGAPAPDGTLVKASTNGVVYGDSAQSTTSEAVYSLIVPGDDTSTTDVIEGGTAGDAVRFTITYTPTAGSPVQLTVPVTDTWHGIWQSGANVKLNLQGYFTTYLPLTVKNSGH